MTTKLQRANMVVIDRPQGGLSTPSKMPGHSWSLDANNCRVGGLLRKIPGTVCGSCYALKGRYVFTVVREAMARRLQGLQNPEWVPSMVYLINHYSPDDFRWFDSGDLPDVETLEKIVAVALATPMTRHWLPTREASTVNKYLATRGPFPDNLAVRLSSARIDGPVPDDHKNPNGLAVSSVATDSATAVQLYPSAHVCPSLKQQGNECKDCRACWNPQQDIVYLEH